MKEQKKPVIKLLRSASESNDLGLINSIPSDIGAQVDVCELSAKAIDTNPVASATESTGCVTSPDPREVRSALSGKDQDRRK